MKLAKRAEASSFALRGRDPPCPATTQSCGTPHRAPADTQPQVGDARLAQDSLITERFVTPWQATLSTSIGLAMKARANVRMARLELDSARAALKSAGPAKQEQARLHVEEAEDKLVQGTETAIGLMKAVLENVSRHAHAQRAGCVFAPVCHPPSREAIEGARSSAERAGTDRRSAADNRTNKHADPQPEPLQNLAALVKAQLIFFSTAAESLAGIEGTIEEAATAAEGEYRTSRGA